MTTRCPGSESLFIQRLRQAMPVIFDNSLRVAPGFRAALASPCNGFEASSVKLLINTCLKVFFLFRF